jgi:hypothetical protein
MPPDPAEITPLEPAPLEPKMEPAPPLHGKQRPFWGYTDLALLAGLLAASIAIIIIAVGVIAIFDPKLRTDPTPALLPTQFVLYGFLYLCFYVVIRLRYDRPVLQSLGWRRSDLNLTAVAIGGVALAFGVAGLAALLHTPKVPSPMDKLAASPVSMAIFGVMAVTIAPLFEELLFRGFIQPLLSRTFGAAIGILLTALLFGSMHAPEYAWAWQYVAAVSLVGVVLGWVREKADSIIPSTVMHGSYNAIFVIALAVTKHV